jgi:uncharacterized protein YcfJ
MDKSMLKGMVLGAAAITAVGGIASYQIIHSQPAFAEVLKVEPAFQAVKTPREVCKDEVVTLNAPVRDRDRIAGTVIGAVVGGLLGNQIGAGDGRTLATVGGAVGGGYAGNRMQKNIRDSDVHTTHQARCKTVYDSQEKIMGFNVTYRLGGQIGVVRMDYDPGDRIPVKDGKLLVLPRPGTSSNLS